MYERDYQAWHRKKTGIEGLPRDIYFYEGEIWWCFMGANIGSEQDGKGDFFVRPVLVLKKFNAEIFWGIPLSSKVRSDRYHLVLTPEDGVRRTALLSQMRLFDSKRLRDKMTYVNLGEFHRVNEGIVLILRPR